MIGFRRNSLSGIDDVAAALGRNPQLERLNISGNRLNDRDAELIAQALKQNTNLQKLFLKSNNITPAGIELISNALYDPSSLNAMESCNHACYVDGMEENDDYAAGNDRRDMTPEQRRRRKLYTLLSTRHFEGRNASHLKAELGERPFVIKIVPRVLECIGRWSVDRAMDSPVPLSLYFELSKSWKMPELYGHQDSKQSL